MSECGDEVAPAVPEEERLVARLQEAGQQHRAALEASGRSRFTCAVSGARLSQLSATVFVPLVDEMETLQWLPVSRTVHQAWLDQLQGRGGRMEEVDTGLEFPIDRGQKTTYYAL